jgi:hypothetical protein
MPETTAITRREFRGYEDAATAEAPKTAQPHPPHAKRQLPHTKRQNVTNPIPLSGLPPQAQLYFMQLNTVLFCIDLVNVRSNLNGSCQDLRNGVNNTQAASIAINTTQAADFVCAAYATNLTYIDPSIVQVFATALYAVELAANFSGTTNTTNLCNSIDMSILTISMFGVDGHGVRSYVCNGNNATLTTFGTLTSSSTTASVGTITPVGWSNQTLSGTGTFANTMASVGTITPIGWGNQTFFGTDTSSTSLSSTDTVTTVGWINDTSFGTAPLATGPLATSASTGTGGWGLPFGNYTGTRTRSYTGPRTNSHSETRTRSGSGFRQPSSTGLPRSILSGTAAQSGSGYDHSTATDVSGRPYSSVTGFPTGLGSGYTQPTGTGVSGWPYGNFTGFRTGSGSSYAPTNATGGLDGPFGLQPSSLEPLSSARLPPSPSTLHYYPAVSPSATPTAFYGYGFEG